MCIFFLCVCVAISPARAPAPARLPPPTATSTTHHHAHPIITPGSTSGLDDECMQWVVPTLSLSSSLTRLDMAKCHLRECPTLFKVISTSPTLLMVNLSENKIENLFKLSLASNFTLRELDLTANRLDDEQILDLVQSLARNRSLTSLCVGQNQTTARVLAGEFESKFS